jgi:membrane protein DedA with SNARE-associated domain
MQLLKFLAWSTLGTAIWSGLLALAGYLLGQRFDKIDQVLGPVSSGIVTLIVLLYVYRQITWHRRHKQA